MLDKIYDWIMFLSWVLFPILLALFLYFAVLGK